MNVKNIVTISSDYYKIRKGFRKDKSNAIFNEDYQLIKYNFGFGKNDDNFTASLDDDRINLLKFKNSFNLLNDKFVNDNSIFNEEIYRFKFKTIKELTCDIASGFDLSFGNYVYKMLKSGHCIINYTFEHPEGFMFPLDSIGVQYVKCNIDYTLESIYTLLHEIMHHYVFNKGDSDDVLVEMCSEFIEIYASDYLKLNRIISCESYHSFYRDYLCSMEIVRDENIINNKFNELEYDSILWSFGFAAALYLRMNARADLDSVRSYINEDKFKTYDEFLRYINLSNEEFLNLDGLDKELELIMK